MKIMIINGPNLNMLGKREPDIYGSDTIEDLIKYTNVQTSKLSNISLTWFQSNHEGEIVEKIQSLVQSSYDALIINPGGYSHSSVAILDALKLINCVKMEVHLSNTHAREDFRKNRITACGVNFILEGLKRDTYTAAIRLLYQIKESGK